MKSFWAALRSIVLPWGATSGRRIVLDAVNGLIAIYDSNDQLVAQIDTVKITQIGPNYTVELRDGRILVFSNAVADLAVAELAPDFLNLTDSAGATQGIQAAGNRLYLSGSGGDGVVVDGTDSGYLKHISIGNAIETWHLAPLAGAWVHAAAPNGPLEYRRTAGGDGELYGRVANGSNTVGAQVCILPAGYRPPKTLRFTLSNGGGGAEGDVEIATDGQVRIRRVFGSASIEFAVSFPLS